MENLATGYDTLADAISDLGRRGYTHDFSHHEGAECLVCSNGSLSLSPDDFQIDDIYRFEGATDPDDEVILYAISSEKYQVKGIVINAYGIYADETSSKIVEKLHKKSNSRKSPIKRHTALRQFSREHHFGLLLVWKIRQGLTSSVDPRRISKYILFFYQNNLRAHFIDEERFLFIKMHENDFVRMKAEADHKKIYELADSIKLNPSDSHQLSEFADLLESHIRYEERILFGHLQNLLSESGLAEIASVHAEKDEDMDLVWNDHFWVL